MVYYMYLETYEVYKDSISNFKNVYSEMRTDWRLVFTTNPFALDLGRKFTSLEEDSAQFWLSKFPGPGPFDSQKKFQ